jgi:putative transcriptional regulator
MPTKKSSARSPKKSSGVLKSRIKRAPVARDIVAGMREAARYLRGEIALPTRTSSSGVSLKSIHVKGIRLKLGLSQAGFAAQYRFNLRTLQEWEQGRTLPDDAVCAYLTVIDRQPKVVAEALGLSA